jgi:hypothetical protein
MTGIIKEVGSFTIYSYRKEVPAEKHKSLQICFLTALSFENAS